MLINFSCLALCLPHVISQRILTTINNIENKGYVAVITIRNKHIQQNVMNKFFSKTACNDVCIEKQKLITYYLKFSIDYYTIRPVISSIIKLSK